MLCNYYNYQINSAKQGTCKVRNEIETKRNEANRNETKPIETKRNETDRNETKPNETKIQNQNEMTNFKSPCFRLL
jgi:septal ring factor EnvC (AmiA/AmiB activator)